MDILNTPTSFPYNGHRFRVGVDDGTDMRLRPHRGLVARPLASPLRGRRADRCTKQLTHQRTKHASNNSADDSFTVNVESMCGHTAQPPHPDHHSACCSPFRCLSKPQAPWAPSP